MQAIGHTIKKSNAAMRLSYVSAEKFTIEVINSLRFDRMISFRDRFHTVDVLLVDDIQFIAGKERTQEEFFHTFNALYEHQKQIVISSASLPKQTNSIEQRHRVSAPGRDVHREAAHHRFVAGNRPPIRRQAPPHGSSLHQQDRRATPHGQGFEPHHHPSAGRPAISTGCLLSLDQVARSMLRTTRQKALLSYLRAQKCRLTV